MKKMLFPGISLLISTAVFAQDPSVLASAGGVNNNKSSISLEWTLGETSVSTITYGENMFTEGFHQPTILLSKNRVPETVRTIIRDLIVTIAPNPVMSVLSVRFSGRLESAPILTLHSSAGTILTKINHISKGRSVNINMSQLPGGVYFLKVADAKGVIKTFEIIKL